LAHALVPPKFRFYVRLVSANKSPAARLRRAWDRCQTLPFGSAIFSRLLGAMVPYTGTIRPRVLELRPGYARVELRDRRGVRNHLGSIHAIAIANLAEVTSGLAMTLALPAEARGIVTSFSIDYVKKARGTLTAECATGPVDASVQQAHHFVAVVRDDVGDEVARGTAAWLIGPTPRPETPREATAAATTAAR